MTLCPRRNYNPQICGAGGEGRGKDTPVRTQGAMDGVCPKDLAPLTTVFHTTRLPCGSVTTYLGDKSRSSRQLLSWHLL